MALANDTRTTDTFEKAVYAHKEIENDECPNNCSNDRSPSTNNDLEKCNNDANHHEYQIKSHLAWTAL
jgi:hypothetical protein